ncbi:hypothetical protein [Spirochaeta dissipatitropha]
MSSITACRAVVSGSDSADDNSEAILRPRDGQVFSETEKIHFLWQDNGLSTTLSSDLDGVLGTDNGFFRYLSGGNHRIKLTRQDKVLDEVMIHIEYGARKSGDRNTFVLNDTFNVIPVRAGRVAAMLRNHLDEIAEFEVDSNAWEGISPMQSNAAGLLLTEKSDPLRPFGAITCSMDSWKNTSQPGIPRLYGNYQHFIMPLSSEVVKRVFYLPDLEKLNTGLYVQIEADLVYDDHHVQLWIDSESVNDYSAAVAAIQEEISKLIVPRVRALWGWWISDVPLVILFSEKLNQNGNILGFFNPSDLFPANDSNDRYPEAVFSNQARMIYVAVPSGEYPFLDDIILATIGHELQHLIHFYTQTYTEIQNGFRDAPYDEVFLAEGLAHLTEVLIGYGITGGNIAFVERFFRSPHLFPLGANIDVHGKRDSAGKRGGMVAFLAWLVWEYGGVAWDEDDPGILIENGAVKLLRDIISSPHRGWRSIEYATGLSSRVLLQNWFQYIHDQISFPDQLQSEIYDTHTLQALNIPLVG